MLKTAAIYFCIVFGAGFALGPIREWILIPKLGSRGAELLEFPLMLLVMVIAARWITRGKEVRLSNGQWIGVGALAAVTVLFADVLVGLFLRHMTVTRIFTQRDPLTGSIYYGLLVVYALFPWLFAYIQNRHSDSSREARK